MVDRSASPPGTSPIPTRPSLSVIRARLRVKNGPCAPDRFMSIESCPATGIASIVRIVGPAARAGVVSAVVVCAVIGSGLLHGAVDAAVELPRVRLAQRLRQERVRERL